MTPQTEHRFWNEEIEDHFSEYSPGGGADSRMQREDTGGGWKRLVIIYSKETNPKPTVSGLGRCEMPSLHPESVVAFRKLDARASSCTQTRRARWDAY